MTDLHYKMDSLVIEADGVKQSNQRLEQKIDDASTELNGKLDDIRSVIYYTVVKLAFKLAIDSALISGSGSLNWSFIKRFSFGRGFANEDCLSGDK